MPPPAPMMTDPRQHEKDLEQEAGVAVRQWQHGNPDYDREARAKSS